MSAASHVERWPPEGFETLADAAAEDRCRAERMRIAIAILRADATGNGSQPAWFRRYIAETGHLPLPRLREADIQRLRSRLLTGARVGRPPRTLASSMAMRRWRERVGIASLHAIEEDGLTDLRTFTIINKKWRVPATDLLATSAARIKAAFTQHLNRLGITNMAGVLFAWLHGEFEPSSGTFVLHLHGWATADKAEALKRLNKKSRWGYVPTVTGGSAVRVEHVRNMAAQLTYTMKSFWPQRTVREETGKRDRTGHRVDEPFQTQYLLWLDRQRPTDMVLFNGGWSPRWGGSEAMRGLYVAVHLKGLKAGRGVAVRAGASW